MINIGSGVAKTIISDVLTATGWALGAGNAVVYNDIFWQFLAYDAGGIKQMEWLKDRRELSADDFEAWSLIATGKPDQVWEGNKKLFYKEQHDILQGRAFDDIPGFPVKVGKKMAEFSTPLFPGATRFGKVGDDLTNFDQRWNWISQYLWPEWRKYSAEKADMVKKTMTNLANPNR